MTPEERNSASRLAEKIEVLDGSRASSKKRAAVRIEDVETLLTLAAIKTKTLTAAPTMADFNSLLSDLRNLSNAVRSVGAAVQRKLV
ncbi:MAG: hypothetical protein DI528_12865 [Shinella sp.]|nr:MAG: hypothetical protein DI528_12865 [Shinella sp.]